MVSTRVSSQLHWSSSIHQYLMLHVRWSRGSNWCWATNSPKLYLLALCVSILIVANLWLWLIIMLAVYKIRIYIAHVIWITEVHRIAKFFAYAGSVRLLIICVADYLPSTSGTFMPFCHLFLDKVSHTSSIAVIASAWPSRWWLLHLTRWIDVMKI